MCQRYCNLSAFPNLLSYSFDSALNRIITCTFYHVVLGLEAGRMSWERHIAYIGGLKNAWSTYVSEITWKKSDMNERAIWQRYYIRCDFAGIILPRVREQMPVCVNAKSCLIKTGKLHVLLTSLCCTQRVVLGVGLNMKRGWDISVRLMMGLWAGLPRNCDSVSHRKMRFVSFSRNKTNKYTLLGSF